MSIHTDDLNEPSRDIDHAIFNKDASVPDTSTDPEGVVTRQQARSGTPTFILDEFNWSFSNNVIDSPEERAKGSNWSLKARPSVITNTIETAELMLAARQKEIHSESCSIDAALREELTNNMRELLATVSCMSGWLVYGLAYNIITQGAKEICSASRFALRAQEWQNRLDNDGDTSQEGPSNMMESAFGQSERGAVLVEAITIAYNEVVSDDSKATPLVCNKKVLTSGAYSALGIEASKHAKKYDHPGLSKAKKSATKSGNSFQMNALLGKS